MLACAFFATSKANAQQVWGTTAFTIEPNTRQLIGYHATEVDFIAWLYYEPYVEGFIYNRFNQVLDFDSDLDEVGRVAEAHTQITYQPGETYFVISDHYVGLIIFVPQPPTGDGPAYWNPFGFGFSGPSGFELFWSFFSGPPGYRTVQFIYLGSTGWRLDFFGVPHIDQISPSSGPLDTTIEVNFSGSNFGINPTVNISGTGVTPGQIEFSTDDRLTLFFHIAANAPIGQRSVTISAHGYTSNSVQFNVGDPTPHITSINPSRGDAGSVVDVTILGTGFGTNPVVNVSGGINATVLAGSGNQQINSRFTIPATTLPGDHQVTVFSNGVNGTGFISGGGSSSTSNSVTFTVNSLAAPRIINFSPQSGQLGTTIEINVIGENFGNNGTLQIGGQGVTVQSYTPVSDPDHQIVATVNIAENAETGNHSLRVSAGGQLSNSVNFLVGDRSPVITSITPPFGFRGTPPIQVLITGRGFGSNPTLTISGTNVNITINQTSDTRIDATFQISSLAEVTTRIVTVTSRGTDGNSFIQTPGATPTAQVPFDIRRADVKIDLMDDRFAPSVERLDIIYTIKPPGVTAPFARLEIFKKNDKTPIFRDDSIAKTGTSIPYTQDGQRGWDGKANQGPDSGKYIGPEGSPYKVVISIADNPAFTNSKKDDDSFRIERVIETSMPAPPPLPGHNPQPGRDDREYDIVKPWRPGVTVNELSTEITLKVRYRNKSGDLVGTVIPFKVAWSFTDPDDTSDDNSVIDTNGNSENDNATVAEGGKRGGTSAMWKVVAGFTASIDSSGQTASSDVSTIGLDLGTTKIAFLSSAIGGDNYKIKAQVNADGRPVKEIEFKKWSVRKRLDFNEGYQMAGGVDLDDYIAVNRVRGAYEGEGYTDYTLGPIRPFPTPSPGPSPSASPSDYLVSLLPPIPLSDPTGVQDDPAAELPTNQQRADYLGPAGAAQTAARNAITDKAQRWFDRNRLEIARVEQATINAVNPTGSVIIGCKKYHPKYDGVEGDGRPSGSTPYYPDGIVIHARNDNGTFITGSNIDPNKDWSRPNEATEALEFPRTINGVPARVIFIFEVQLPPTSPVTAARKPIVGRHEIGHASDHVLFGPPNVTDDRERDHWTSGLMERASGQTLPARPDGDPNFAKDSILRLRGRKR
jgi:hypothetical protein